MSKLRIARIVALFFLLATFSSCATTPGVYTRLDSTAPAFGPIFLGISRVDAERHLGHPILTMPLDEGPSYVVVYEYQQQRSTFDTIATDFLDYATFGLGTYMISPMDRFEGTKHLIAITYQRENPYQEQLKDRVIAYTDRLTNNPLAIHSSEKSLGSAQKGKWDEVIRSASFAIYLDPQLSTSYVNRAWAYSEKGLHDKAIQDCNKALSLSPKSAPAYNNRGLAYHRKGELKKAVGDYQKACGLGLNIACLNLKGLVGETQ